MNTLTQLNFDNTFARLSGHFYSRVHPMPLSRPYLVSFNNKAADLIDINSTEAQREDFVEYFSGNRLLPGSTPLAMLYAGHQFGHFVPQLGDGRAILLGEIKNNAGEYWDLQLKGAGITPYSRRGDGRAVLRSSIREYLCSEAMHSLGIPTTRALCIVGSDAHVMRETVETSAVLTRLSPSHVRFGSFEVFYYRRQYAQISALANYVIARHFPEVTNAADKYLQFLDTVITRTAKLMAQWQAVGFAHGVMNTDNMSILGLTFDYGPFGFMESYNPKYICNHSDESGRYAFDQQPEIAYWNLSALAQTLTPLIPEVDIQNALGNYSTVFNDTYITLMNQKLGLTQNNRDFSLVWSLLKLMRTSQVDYTNFFRALSNFKTAPDEKNTQLRDQFIDREAFDMWANEYRQHLQNEPASEQARSTQMNKVNPKYILRNYLAQVAIEKAQQEKNFSEIDILLKLLRQPFDEQPDMAKYAAPAPDWAQHIEVSCSS